jgi:microcin C transport system substrate-binding protein
VISAKSREELNVAARALDRVLRAGHYWVPHWYKASNNIAYWDKFSRPETKPRFDRGVLDTWWYDETKAAKLAASAAPSPDGAAGPAPRRPFLLIAALIGLVPAFYFIMRMRRSARTE